ncbi:type II 3-dehydroquinate dehydratase [Actinomycetospora corticicola]|uniref:3-dehydroquinate dehydratase n=1 Tax=Actinomycetospora corticicola TaxID=663602 RepID=A0A7Y9DXJ0_9PSEU|nr:type II 3-dehydroquinate dehydratase [Actinomycetospora corticicola]NYD37235.1 3-dehydroquinate dehydratase-2 [Actinomycetospora corticicola]
MSQNREPQPPRRVLLLHGPNLNLLGRREPEIYGSETLADVDDRARALGTELGLTVDARQSNHEGVLVDAIHEAMTDFAAVVINPGAYTHTSVAIRDALAAIPGPIVEVHISNVHTREPFRHHSYVSPVATAVIAGAGTLGYDLALRFVATRI